MKKQNANKLLFWMAISVVFVICCIVVNDRTQTSTIELVFASLAMGSWFMLFKEYFKEVK